MLIPINVLVYIFIVIVAICYIVFLESRQSRGGYINFDGCATMFLVFLLAVFTLVWGGIYWW